MEELKNFKTNYLKRLEEFNENFIEKGVSVEKSNFFSEENHFSPIGYKLLALFIDCLMLQRVFIRQENILNSQIDRIDRIFKSFDLLLDIKNKEIVVAMIPFLKAKYKSEFYQYLVYHVNYFSNLNNQAAISELNMK